MHAHRTSIATTANLPIGDPPYRASFFAMMEQFVDRYRNVALAAPQYEKFAPVRGPNQQPVRFNARVMSCILIQNDIPFRWRGRYNEDVILSADVLEAGWCTLLFYAFLQEKVATQTMGGGNTTELYAAGTAAKSRMFYNLHPDMVKLVTRYGRDHHHADFGRFAGNKLIRTDEPITPVGQNLVLRPKGQR